MHLDLAHDLSHWFDLDHVPYTVRGSRLFVRRGDAGLTVYRAAYERSLAESVAVEGLRIVDSEGVVAAVQQVDPWRITFDGGAYLVVTADHRVVVELPEGFRVEGIVNEDETTLEVMTPFDTPCEDSHAPAQPVTSQGTQDPEPAPTPDAPTPPMNGHDRPARHDSQVVAHDLATWMAKCPEVDEQWRDVTRFCWWVLGANTLELDAPEGLRRAVVPSKIGYVGLWQWDAYFMAIGLRHGDIGLAAEQLRIALAQQGADGQLPDVVHEDGILASSDDLPPGDLENLRRMGSPSLAHSRVPLTKPPLTALAVQLLAERAGTEVIDEFLPAILRAQEWWYSASAPAGQPAYLHPYSSGLDDSPIFDHEAILVSPDLTSYLILADRIMAGWLAERGEDDAARTCEERADRTVAALAATWDAERGFFPSIGEQGRPVSSETIVSLMPVLAQGLPRELLGAVLAAITDPQRFGAPHPLPTVAMNDPDFSPIEMWRGPVWVNTNWLVATGLRSMGEVELAEQIETATVDMVAANGPNEYFRPDTGVKPPRSTTVFGWSAALTVDLAVRLSAAGEHR